MIYFIKNEDYVKIGYTSDIHNRLSQLQVSSPTKLKLLGLIEGSTEDEQFHHEKFKHLHSSGEWFIHTQGLENFISGLSKELMWKYGFIENESSIYGLIKETRLKNNISMEELAERLSVTKQAVMDMEKRDAQGRVTIGLLSRYLSAMDYKLQTRAIPIVK